MAALYFPIGTIDRPKNTKPALLETLLYFLYPLHHHLHKDLVPNHPNNKHVYIFNYPIRNMLCKSENVAIAICYLYMIISLHPELS